jgi:ATP-binding cassette subfamily B protein RaxB
MKINKLLQNSFWNTKRLPIILQTEAAECGLACLAMVSSYWGYQIDLPNMRRRFSVSLKGLSLRALISMAQALSLQCRPVKLGIENLPDLKLPCILHWDLNHFVVLKSISGVTAVIHDPGAGERSIKMERLSKHFSGVAVELTPTSEFIKDKNIQKFSLISLVGRIDGLKRSLSQILLLGLVLQICMLVAPFYMQWIVDEALLTADQDLVTTLGIGFIVLLVIKTVVNATRSWLTTVMATNLNIQWFGNAFSHLLKLPLDYFEKRHTGDIVSRFGSIETMQRHLTTQFIEGIIDGILMVGTFAMMLAYSVKLAFIAAIAIIIYALVRWIVFKPLREASAEQIIHAAKQQTIFLESVRGIQSIRLFSRNEERRTGWMNSLTDQFNADIRVSKLVVSYQTFNSFLFGAERIIIIWIAALLVMSNQFSIGMLYAFIAYKDQFSERTSGLIDKIFELKMMRLHGERLADIVFTKPESEENDFEINVDDLDSTIEVKNLSFRYSDSEPYIIKDFSIKIPEGQCLAVAGPSGCGKTTLMKLLLGLLKPTAGEILIGGIPMEKLGAKNFRKMIGTVMQEDSLFAGSISDNIGFFDSEPNNDRIYECAKAAAIFPEIQAMPMGFNTLIGDIGTGISGGQKQRLLLARALYREPRLLYLDEATSHLDIWNEQAVNSSIGALELTRVIIAHRPETIAMAERVIILQNGTIFQDIIQNPSDQTKLAA